MIIPSAVMTPIAITLITTSRNTGLGSTVTASLALTALSTLLVLTALLCSIAVILLTTSPPRPTTRCSITGAKLPTWHVRPRIALRVRVLIANTRTSFRGSLDFALAGAHRLVLGVLKLVVDGIPVDVDGRCPFRNRSSGDLVRHAEEEV